MTIKIQIKDGEKGDLHTKVEIKNYDFSVLDVAEEGKLSLPYGCRSGSCGSCRVIVLEGLELLEARTPIEEDTLDRCKDPSNTRLACRARFKANAEGTLCLSIAPAVKISFD